MKESRETLDDLIRESNKLKEMIREDQIWYQVKQSCNLIFDNLKAGISIMDRDGIYTFINQVAAARYPFSPEEMIGKKYSEIFGKDEAKFFEEKIFSSVIDEGREIRSRNSIQLGNTTYNLEYHCLPVRDEYGKITGILNITFDISLEEKRKKYRNIQEYINYISFHTETLEDTIRVIFNLLCQIDCIRSAGIYIFDPTKKLLELVHHYNLPDEFVSQVRSYDTDSMNYKIVIKGVPQYNIDSQLSEEEQMINRSLGIKIVAVIPMIDEDQLIGCFTFTNNKAEDFNEEDKTFIESMVWRLARVITLMRSRDQFLNANQELNKKISELKEKQQMLIQKSKLESLGELSAGMAHEINQPLMVISLSIENILQKIVVGQKNLQIHYLQKKFESILHNVNRIQQIIDNMRTFARDHSSIIFERVNVSQVIERTLELIRVQYRNEGIKLLSETIDENLHVIGNPFKLEQVIMNLLSNSRYAVNERETRNGLMNGQKEIRIKVGQTENNIIIEVCDNGTGILPENIDKLFTPFFTTKREGEGTGLGLPIVYGIVKELNGEVEVESRINEFTRFRVILPSI
jgi:PAS domain S-box-containing protein